MNEKLSVLPKVFIELPTPPRIEDASWGVNSLTFSGCTCLQAVALEKSQGFGEGLTEVKGKSSKWQCGDSSLGGQILEPTLLLVCFPSSQGPRLRKVKSELKYS